MHSTPVEYGFTKPHTPNDGIYSTIWGTLNISFVVGRTRKSAKKSGNALFRCTAHCNHQDLTPAWFFISVLMKGGVLLPAEVSDRTGRAPDRCRGAGAAFRRHETVPEENFSRSCNGIVTLIIVQEQQNKAKQPGSVAVNHGGLWIPRQQFESAPGYSLFVTFFVHHCDFFP